MGIFDLFGREPKSRTDTTRRDFDAPIQSTPQEEKKAPFTVVFPSSFDDVEKIINLLKIGKTAVVHLSNLKNETQIRVLDMLSGAVFALGGGVYEMEKNVFMFSPSGVDVY